MSEILTVSVGVPDSTDESPVTLTLDVDDPTRENWTSEVVGEVGPEFDFSPGEAVLTVTAGKRIGLVASAVIEGQGQSDLAVRGLTPFA